MKTVSIIIPTYNRWPQVCDAIDSALKQSHNETHCVVVDDASSDNTPQLLAEKYGDTIRVIANKGNRGQSACRNQGAELTDSDFICFLDSDDLLEPNAVASRLSLLEENNILNGVAFGLFRKPGRPNHILANKKVRGDRLTLSEYVHDMEWCHNNSFLIDRKIFLQQGGYNSRLRNREDIELLIRLLCKLDFYFCGEEVGQIRDVCDNRARNNYANILEPENSFAHFVRQNPDICNHVNPADIHFLIASEVEEQLRAFYRLARYAEYRTLFRQAVKKNHIINKRKFYKRYLLSSIHVFFARIFGRKELPGTGQNMQKDSLFIPTPDINILKSEVLSNMRDKHLFTSIKRKSETLFTANQLKDFCLTTNNVCSLLDQLIEEGHIYKSDATSTVASVNFHGNNWVIKRYNNKGFETTVKLIARSSRAERAFTKALVLGKIAIATPQPLFYAVRYHRSLPYDCYIVCEKSAGDTICNLYDQGYLSVRDWPTIVNKTAAVLEKLHGFYITHGDIKPTNILYNQGEIEIIDLDAMRLHWNPKLFEHFRTKDMETLQRRIAGYVKDKPKEEKSLPD